MPAPTYGSSYLEINSPLVGNPANAGESTNLDAAFNTAWSQVQQMCPLNDEGDTAFKLWAASLAYRYKAGGTYAPTIASLTPNTAVHAAATTPVTITGTNYDPNAVVVFNGLDMVSAAHSPTTITISVLGSQIPTAGTYPVKVRNTDGQITTATNFTAT